MSTTSGRGALPPCGLSAPAGRPAQRRRVRPGRVPRLHNQKPQAFGTLIPAIGATPYVLCGAIYPIAVLPTGIKWLIWVLPWTHSVSLLRYGLMGDAAAGLHQIWPDDLSPTGAALLSLAIVATFAALTQTAAHRAFTRSTLK